MFGAVRRADTVYVVDGSETKDTAEAQSGIEQEDIMKRTTTNQPANYGLYISTSHLDARFVGADGEALAGLEGASYVRVPTLLALMLAPVFGGAFVIAFPILVLVSVAAALAEKALRAREASGGHAWLAGPRWEPAASYLSRGEKDAAPQEAAPELSDLRAEVDARRATEGDVG